MEGRTSRVESSGCTLSPVTAASPSADPDQRTARVAPGSAQGRSVQSAGAFAVAAAGQRVLAFLLLPIYTSALLPSEYGRVSLLLSIYAASYVVLAAGLDVAVMRKYFMYDTTLAQREYVGAVWSFHAVAAIGIATAAAVVCLAVLPTSGVLRPDEVALTVIAAGLLAVATIVPLTLLRAEQRLRPYLALSLLAGIGTAGFTIVFVVLLDGGPMGWVLALICANLVGIGGSAFVTPLTRRIRDRMEAIRDSLRLGVPLIPHALAQWALQVADRLILATLTTPAVVGVYSLGANLSVPGLVIMQSLNQGFMPTYAQAARSPEAAGRLRETITLQVALILCVGLGLALVGPPLVTVVAPAAYGGAASVIPWLTLGYVFMGLYFVPMNTLTLTLGKTRMIWVFTASAAAIALASIPPLYHAYGISGAASASAVGYGTQFFVISAYAYRLGARVDVAWARCIGICLAAITTYLVADAALPDSGLDAAGLRLLASALGIVLVLALTGTRVRESIRRGRHR